MLKSSHTVPVNATYLAKEFISYNIQNVAPLQSNLSAKLTVITAFGETKPTQHNSLVIKLHFVVMNWFRNMKESG